MNSEYSTVQDLLNQPHHYSPDATILFVETPTGTQAAKFSFLVRKDGRRIAILSPLDPVAFDAETYASEIDDFTSDTLDEVQECVVGSDDLRDRLARRLIKFVRTVLALED